jgi:gliding motility-associated-like protein
VEVTIHPQTVMVVNDPSPVCAPSTVDLTASAVTAGSDALLSFGYYTDAAATVLLATPSAVTVSGRYYIRGVDPSGSCPLIDSVEVVVSPVPVLVVNDPLPVCAPATVDLTVAAITLGSVIPASSTITYWTNALATDSLKNEKGVAASGTYYIKVEAAGGCWVLDSIQVIVNPQPSLVVNNPAAVCTPATVDLTASAITAGSTILPTMVLSYWKDALATDPLVNSKTVSASGTYYIKMEVPGECPAIDSVEVIVNPLPVLAVTDPAPVCAPATVDLSDASIVQGSLIPASSSVSYWLDALATVSLVNENAVSVSGTYYIKVEAPGGCWVLDSVQVIVNPQPVLVVNNPAGVCVPATIDLTASAITAGSDALSFEYYTDAAAMLALSNPSKVASSGTYYIKGIDPITHCSVLDSVRVVINIPPALVVNDPATACEPETVDLTAAAVTAGSSLLPTMVLSYWRDSLSINPLVNEKAVSVAGTYYIKVETSGGCFDIQPVDVSFNTRPKLVITDPGMAYKPATIDLTDPAITAGSDADLGYEYYLDATATKPLSNYTNVASGGTYYIKGTSSTTGCYDIQAVIVKFNDLPVFVYTKPGVVCEPNTIDLSDPAITAGSDASLTFEYYRNASATIPLSDYTNIAVGGTYYIKGSEPISGFLVIQPVVVTINAQPLLVITNPNEVCTPSTIDLSQAWITAGSDPNLKYEYYTDALASSALNNYKAVASSGTYYIKAINTSTGCFTIQPVQVIINKPLSPILAINKGVIAECAESPVQTLYADSAVVREAGITITWFDQATGGSKVVSPTLSAIDSKTYYAEASNGFCISATRTPVTLTIYGFPAIPVTRNGNELVACEASPIQTLDATTMIVPVSGITLHWYDAETGGTEVSSPTLSSVRSIDYYAEASNGSCPSPGRTKVTLTINKAPAAPVSSGDLPECALSPVQTLNANSFITPEAGITITWYDKAKGGTRISNPTLNTKTSKTYYAEAFDGSCPSAVRTRVTLTIYAIPDTAVAIVTEKPTCNNWDGAVAVTSPLGANFRYSIDGGKYRSSTAFDTLKWGDHFITVKNILSGCESAPGKVVVPAIPPAPVMTAVPVASKCFGGYGSINFTVTNAKKGVYTIKYEGGEFQNVNVSATGTATVPALAGDYRNLTIYNATTGCDSYDPQHILNVKVTEPSEIVITPTVIDLDLKKQREGSISLSVTGGTGKYSYMWGNGLTAAAIYNLRDGSYTVTVTDENGCVKPMTILVPVPNYPPVAVDDSVSSGCNVIYGNVITNDSDIEMDELFIGQTPVVAPLHGSVSLNSDGTFIYRVYPPFAGIDSFVYALYDKTLYPDITATVFIHVISDMDHDGIADTEDPDADGDGILNVREVANGGDWKTANDDTDDNPNWLDIDSDGDGIVDYFEAQASSVKINPANLDVDSNGVDDAYDRYQFTREIIPVDTDGDGIPDFLDKDSDNDGVPDAIEGHDYNSDGKPDHVAKGTDADGDGLDGAYDTVINDCNVLANAIGSNAAMQDFDGDGKPDWRDDNDDDDAFLTNYEDLNGDHDWSNDDIDYDGYPEYLDYGRDCDLLIPNAFSPNGDNIHEVFQIYCINHYPNAHIYIFDQLGNKIFEKDHYGNMDVWKSFESAWWTGKPDRGPGYSINELVPPGTYYYVLDLGNGEVKKSFVFVSY